MGQLISSWYVCCSLGKTKHLLVRSIILAKLSSLLWGKHELQIHWVDYSSKFASKIIVFSNIRIISMWLYSMLIVTVYELLLGLNYFPLWSRRTIELKCAMNQTVWKNMSPCLDIHAQEVKNHFLRHVSAQTAFCMSSVFLFSFQFYFKWDIVLKDTCERRLFLSRRSFVSDVF